MENFLRDLRHALRLLARRPLTTAIAVSSLGLGIGANAAIFSMANALFLRPVAVENPERIVSIYSTDANLTSGMTHLPFSYPNYLDVRERTRTVEAVAAYAPLLLALGGEEPEQVFSQIVSSNYFDVLGIKPVLGRAFRPEEDATEGTHPVAVLSHSLWQRRFGADPSLVGRDIIINGRSFVVIGVAPPGFRGPSSLGAPQIWVPLMMHREVLPASQVFDQRRWRMLSIVGRMAPGVEMEAVRAELSRIAIDLEAEHPSDNQRRNIVVLPLALASIDPNERLTFVRGTSLMLSTSGLLLFIACANIANLLLAQAAARSKEIAMRFALGARRGQLLRQLLIEGLVLAALGGGLGLLFGFAGQRLLWRLRPPVFSEGSLDLSFDWRVAVFIAAVALGCGLLFSLAPALQASGAPLTPALKSDASAPSKRSSLLGLRGALVVAQVSVCMVALIGAGLFLRSLGKVQAIDPGFSVEGLVHMSLNLRAVAYSPERGREFQERLLERLNSLPQVRSASLSEARVLSGSSGLVRSVIPEGRDPNDATGAILVRTSSISPNHLGTLGIPLLFGRRFGPQDNESAPPVAIINEALAQQLWPGHPAVGRRLTLLGEDPQVEVVGVAGNAKYITLGEEPQPFIYFSLSQRPSPLVTVYARAAGPVPALLASVRQEIRRLEPNLPLVAPAELSEDLRTSLWAPRLGAQVLALFGTLAMALAALGLYGVLAYTVHQRRTEIGVRAALGASRRRLLTMVLRQGLLLVVVGLLLGTLMAFLSTRVITGFLHGLDPLDLPTFVAVALVLLAVGVLAAALPAHRASRVPPFVALRTD